MGSFSRALFGTSQQTMVLSFLFEDVFRESCANDETGHKENAKKLNMAVNVQECPERIGVNCAIEAELCTEVWPIKNKNNPICANDVR